MIIQLCVTRKKDRWVVTTTDGKETTGRYECLDTKDEGIIHTLSELLFQQEWKETKGLDQ